MLAAVARRARRRLRPGVSRRRLPPKRLEVHLLGAAASEETTGLAERQCNEERRSMLEQATRPRS